MLSYIHEKREVIGLKDSREIGQGLVEYALILILVVIVVLVVLTIFGSNVGTMFSNVVVAI